MTTVLNPFSTVSEVTAALEAGTITAEALATAALERIARLDPALSAFVCLTSDRALAEARASDARRASGQCIGPLDGVPYAVKDIFDVAGEPTVAGSKLLLDHMADRDCTAVRRLSAAGMVLIGKTHTVQFAFHINGTNRDFGTPHNPWSETHHLPGGSSSGSAVAVAAGLVPVALGSDTGGSIRVPAALCGIVGFKPTTGLAGRGGVRPLSWSLDAIGPLTRSVGDALTVFRAMEGPDPDDETTTLARRPVTWPNNARGQLDGIEILLCETVFPEDCDSEVLAAADAMAERLAACGATIRRGDFGEIAEAHHNNRDGTVIKAEAWSVNGPLFEAHPDEIDPIGAWVETGRDITAADYYHALRTRADVQRRVAECLGPNTAILCPTTPTPAVPLASVGEGAPLRGGYSRNTGIGNYLNLSAISLPAGMHSSGLPMGAMIAARPFEDALTMRIALALEAVDGPIPAPDLGWIAGAEEA